MKAWPWAAGISLWILLAPIAEAAADDSLAAGIEAANQKQLHRHPTWRRLLEFPDGGRRSELRSNDFFLSKQGATDPESELEASLRAVFTPVSDKPDQHAQCRFPARWLWLKQQLPDLAASVKDANCPALSAWLKPEQLRSVSVIMVSGFYGSPAASFGHALIKLNNGEQALQRGLLDQGANFGAVIPEEDQILAYVYKGLFGHYEGAFHRNEFYLQDRIYARAQSRDMWEYELKLEADQVLLIALHLWEIGGQPFQYFFLRQNCAYRIARLLELANGQTLTRPSRRAYPPALLFHELEKASMKPVRFIASPKRLLSARIERLSSRQRALIDGFVREPDVDALKRESVTDQVLISDVLIDLHDYQIAKAGEEQKGQQNLRAIRQKLIELRFSLPMETAGDSITVSPTQVEPILGTRPVRLGIGPQIPSDAAPNSLSFRATLFDNALAGRNGPLGSQLRFADLELRSHAERDLYLNRLELARAQNLRDVRVAIPGERQWSWRVGGGWAQSRVDCDSCLEFAFHAASGAAFLGSSSMVYAMAEGIIASRDQGLAVAPVMGILAGQPRRLAAGLEAAYRFHRYGADDGADLLGFVVLPLGGQSDLRLSWREHQGREWSLGLNWYW